MKHFAYINPTTKEVGAIIPEFDKDFPDIPKEQRYDQHITQNCVEIPENVEVIVGMLYNELEGTFVEPPTNTTEVSTKEGFTITEEEINNAYEEGVNNVE